MAIAIATNHASRLLHKCMLANVFKSKMEFFEVNPLGRMMNRFTKDIHIVDQTLPDKTTDWLEAALDVLSTIVIITICTPLFLTGFVPVMIIYFLIQVGY
jgi:ABC-type multidrug transport system fused ATPase/permease subunit